MEIVVSQATIELAAQTVTVDLGTPPGVEITVNQATIELVPQAPSVDVGAPPGVEITVSQATIELAPQAVSVDLGSPPAGVDIAVITATIELVPRSVTIQAPGAALLIGVPTPLPISVISLDLVDHDAATISHSVVASSNPGTSSSLLKSDDDGQLQLPKIGVGKAPVEPLDVLGNIQLTGDLMHTGDLTILPLGGDVLFEDADIQAHDWISGSQGWGISHAGDADFRNITADSLTVEAFIADVNLALAGSQFVTKSIAILSRAFTVPAATAVLYVYDLPGFEDSQVFENGDYVRLRYVDRSGGGLVVGDAWGTVSSYTDLSGGEQSWTWTYVSGSIGQIIGEGGLALDYGQSGDGYWHVTTLQTASPYAEVGTWQTDPSNPANHTIHLRLGQLDGITGIGDEWGLWAGQDTDIYLLLSDTNFEAHGLRLSLYDSGSNEAIRLDPNAPYLAVGEPLPTGPDAGGDGLWVGQEGGSYKLRLGKAAGLAIRWTGAAVELRNASNEAVIVLDSSGNRFDRPMTLGSSGGIWQGSGTFSSPTTGLKIWNDSGVGRIGGYNSSAAQWYANTDGKLYAGQGDVVLDEDGITIEAASTLGDQNYIKWITASLSEIFKIGADSAGNIEATGITDSILTLQVTGGSRLVLTDHPTDGPVLDYSGVFKHSSSGKLVYPMHYLTASLTSTSWDGDSKTAANNGTIDLSAVFGVPAGVKAVLVRLSAQSSSVGNVAQLGPSSGQNNAVFARTQVTNVYSDSFGLVPCDANGDVYFTCVGTCNVNIQIWGYAL